MIAVRGATTVAHNGSDEIKAASIELFSEIVRINEVDFKDITAIFFSCTQDITKDYPGKFVREHFKLDKTAIMHTNEMFVENSLKLCIRVLLLIDAPKTKDVTYVYLNKAKKLRKDLFNIK